MASDNGQRDAREWQMRQEIVRVGQLMYARGLLCGSTAGGC